MATVVGRRISLSRSRVQWLAAIAAAMAVLLTPAVWNGFPFMFYDSGSYIELAVKGGFRPERSAFYGLFLSVFRPALSLWPAMVAQVAMTVLVIAGFARVLLPELSPARFFALMLALAFGTSLPWLATQVLPDIMTPLLALCLYLLGFHAAALSTRHKAALIAVSVFGTTSHASHLGLTAGLGAVVIVMEIATRRLTLGSVGPRWALPTLVFWLSLAALVTSNFVRTDEVFITRSGPAFVFARLVQDGIAKRVLDDTCPASGYKLCAYKDHLPADSNDYLWGVESPFQRLGKFVGTADESRAIIAESVKRYPLLHLKMAARDTWEQFTAFDTGDGIEYLNDTPVPAMQRSAPGLVAGYKAARQQNDGIAFRWINAFQVPIGALSIAALAAILAAATLRRAWDDRVFLPAFLLLALIGNAFICGTLSSPHDRYQSRLIWPTSFAVLLLAAKQRSRVPVVPAELAAATG